MTFNRTQLENAELPMLMTVLGRVTPANWMQLANIEDFKLRRLSATNGSPTGSDILFGDGGKVQYFDHIATVAATVTPTNDGGNDTTYYYGAETSIDKVLMATAEQAVFDLADSGLGVDMAAAGDPLSARWRSEYLYSRAATIYGGSAEIQRNIIARRLLDLGNDR